jgi:hypothetical protein
MSQTSHAHTPTSAVVAGAESLLREATSRIHFCRDPAGVSSAAQWWASARSWLLLALGTLGLLVPVVAVVMLLAYVRTHGIQFGARGRQ